MNEQVDQFRAALLTVIQAVAKSQPREWNPALLTITEGRRTHARRYDWCGDLVSFVLARAGVKARCLNRKSVNGTHALGQTANMLRAWAGDESWNADADVRAVVARLLGDERGANAWHVGKEDRCEDSYTPQCGDVLVLDTGAVEMVVETTEKGIRVLAPMMFGEARVIRRNFGHFKLCGAIEVKALSPAPVAVEAPPETPAAKTEPAGRAKRERRSQTPAPETTEARTTES